jgi:hypothetical protein
MDVHFVLTAIEKRHLAATKLADTILDSSTNKAVSRLHYGVHGLRLMLAHMLVELMEPPDHEEFWRVYALRDGTRLRPTLVRLQESLRSRPVARRQRELLSDALAWGADHAEDLLEYARSELDAPNLVALTLLMAGVHDTVSERGGKVGRFVHDQQQQFGTFMAEMYGVLKHLAMPTHATALMTQIERISTYDCKIEILPSRDVIGLQVIDVMVWLYRRSISDSMRDFPACASLVEFVDSRAYIRHHSKDQLARDAERAYADIMHMPIDDPERLAKASKMTAEIEQARKQRMRSM